MYLRVEGRVYAMQLPPTIEMVPETYQDEDNEDYGYPSHRRTTIAQPPSLVLNFSKAAMQLRLFRSTGTADDCAEDRDFWTGIRQTLLDLRPTAVFRVAPEEIMACSPGRSVSSGSTTTNYYSGGGGQKLPAADGGRSSSTLSHVDVADVPAAHNNPNNNETAAAAPTTPTAAAAAGTKRPAPDAVATTPTNPETTTTDTLMLLGGNEEEEQARRCIRRRHEALDACVTSLGTVRHILHLPAANVVSASSSSDDDHEQLGPLLTQTARQLQAAYRTTADEDAATVMESSSAAQHPANYEHEMEATLASFFPAPNRRLQKQQRSSSSSQNLSEKEAAATLERLLEEQKRATSERHRLFLLPLRG